MPYLGCSPDGLVGANGIIEVKCPYTAKDFNITTDTVPYLQEDDLGIFYLMKTHEYYYQVQGTLLCTDRQWCDLTVWTFKDLKVIRIHRDETFIAEMKLKLCHFFDNHFKGAILQKFFYRS